MNDVIGLVGWLVGWLIWFNGHRGESAMSRAYLPRYQTPRTLGQSYMDCVYLAKLMHATHSLTQSGTHTFTYLHRPFPRPTPRQDSVMGEIAKDACVQNCSRGICTSKRQGHSFSLIVCSHQGNQIKRKRPISARSGGFLCIHTTHPSRPTHSIHFGV